MPANNGLGHATITCLAINAKAHIFAGMEWLGIFRSLNSGADWKQVYQGVSNTFVHSLAINSSGHIYAGTRNEGVIYSTDNGESWKPAKTGLANAAIRAMTISLDGFAFAGTNEDGVFRSAQSTTAVKDHANAMPTQFALQQNYPNPFLSEAKSRLAGNPSTTIQFSLPRSGYVTLKVYNTLGENVATLVAENLSAGRHQVEWNAEKLGSGIYLYHLQAGALVQTKKLVVVK